MNTDENAGLELAFLHLHASRRDVESRTDTAKIATEEIGSEINTPKYCINAGI